MKGVVSRMSGRSWLMRIIDQLLCDENFVYTGDHVVIMGGLPVASLARTNFVKLHRIGKAEA
jgi:pyruvate kinase